MSPKKSADNSSYFEEFCQNKQHPKPITGSLELEIKTTIDRDREYDISFSNIGNIKAQSLMKQYFDRNESHSHESVFDISHENFNDTGFNVHFFSKKQIDNSQYKNGSQNIVKGQKWAHEHKGEIGINFLSKWLEDHLRGGFGKTQVNSKTNTNNYQDTIVVIDDFQGGFGALVGGGGGPGDSSDSDGGGGGLIIGGGGKYDLKKDTNKNGSSNNVSNEETVAGGGGRKTNTIDSKETGIKYNRSNTNSNSGGYQFSNGNEYGHINNTIYNGGMEGVYFMNNTHVFKIGFKDWWKHSGSWRYGFNHDFTWDFLQKYKFENSTSWKFDDNVVFGGKLTINLNVDCHNEMGDILDKACEKYEKLCGLLKNNCQKDINDNPHTIPRLEYESDIPQWRAAAAEYLRQDPVKSAEMMNEFFNGLFPNSPPFWNNSQQLYYTSQNPFPVKDIGSNDLFPAEAPYEEMPDWESQGGEQFGDEEPNKSKGPRPSKSKGPKPSKAKSPVDELAKQMSNLPIKSEVPVEELAKQMPKTSVEELVKGKREE